MRRSICRGWEIWHSAKRWWICKAIDLDGASKLCMKWVPSIHCASILFSGWTSTSHVLFSLYRASLFQDRLTRCIYNSRKDAVTQSKSISPRFQAEVARKDFCLMSPRPRHSEWERRLPQKTLLSAAAFLEFWTLVESNCSLLRV